jgi:enoyl-CoA hydratase/carnithine racemase
LRSSRSTTRPSNLFDIELMQEMDSLGHELEADDGVHVIVFDSANPEFFISHVEVGLLLHLPVPAPPKPPEVSFFHAMVDRYRAMGKASIAKIEGRARGGGSAFVLSLDMPSIGCGGKEGATRRCSRI